MNKLSSNSRLASLDILRGFVLFLLVFLQPILWSLAHCMDNNFSDFILYHFDHATWEGLHLWDLVQPLFLFVSGASIPFSFSKFLKTGDKKSLYKKVIKRTLILYFLGMLVQGNLLGLDPQHIYLYSNTLQSIAVGYLITSLIVINLSFRWQIVATLVLLTIYSVPMMICGDYSPDLNFAERVESIVLGRFRDGAYCNESGMWVSLPGYHYAWVWGSLNFGVSVMLGYFAGKIVKDYKTDGAKVVKYLLIAGLSLVLCGWLWSFNMPVIKRIWTSSMTLLSGGYCFILFALFYYWIDYKGHHSGLDWLNIYGKNSILAYLLGEKINFRCVVDSVSWGLEQYLDYYYPVWLSFGNYAIIFLILLLMYKRKLFIKI